jgi:hypothetical protein
MLVLIDLGNATAKCENVFEKRYNKSDLTCHQFSSWNEANEALKATNFTNPTAPVFMKPSEPILLTSELNTSLVLFSSALLFYGLSGVNVYPWPAWNNDQKGFSLFLSKIEFHVNSTPPTGYICSPNLLPDDSATSVSLLSSHIKSIIIIYGNKYSSSAICPFLFKNAQLTDGMRLEFQVQSFLFVTLFRFQQVNFTNTSTINSAVDNLQVKGYNYELDTSLMHPLVFEESTFLECHGTIKLIQKDLFKHFQTYLTSIAFILYSLGNFYHKIGLEWMDYLAIGSNVNLSSSKVP